ncbi:MAG: DUF669 domain-containing protein [Tissierellia bacterium]|nr:DUF669 domain-containing protein [Tissierellia bacterium]
MTSYNEDLGRELGWEDDIENESDFILLPEGEYDFRITNFERARHNGSANLPPCNKAVVYCTIDREGGKATIKNNLFLHTKTESFLSAFFISIGQKEKGKPVKMNWNKVLGATGRCKVSQYTGRDGNINNDIKSFLPPAEEPNKGFVPGTF